MSIQYSTAHQQLQEELEEQKELPKKTKELQLKRSVATRRTSRNLDYCKRKLEDNYKKSYEKKTTYYEEKQCEVDSQ